MLLAGCGAATTSSSTTEGNRVVRGGMANRRETVGLSSSTMFMMNSTTGTIADLGVGKTVVIMGTTGADGLVQAQRIIVGFGAGFGRPEGVTGTPRMMASGTPRTGGEGRNFRGQGQGVSSLNGEIIGQDSSSLTLKKRDGGSAIVYYSAKTDIRVAATSTPR